METPADSLFPSQDDPTRLRLLDAAEEVFAEVGFEAATVREICERAKVKNIGAINYYFQGKDRLYQETVIRAFRTCKEGAPFPEWPVGTPPIQKLRDFIRTMMEQMLSIPKISAMQLMMREMTMPTPLCAAGVHQHIKPMADILHSILGEMIPNVRLDHRWLIGFSIVGQCLIYRQNRAILQVLLESYSTQLLGDVELLAEHVIRFTFAALGLQPSVLSVYGGQS